MTLKYSLVESLLARHRCPAVGGLEKEGALAPARTTRHETP
jgi:hypothetical protein